MHQKLKTSVSGKGMRGLANKGGRKTCFPWYILKYLLNFIALRFYGRWSPCWHKGRNQMSITSSFLKILCDDAEAIPPAFIVTQVNQTALFSFTTWPRWIQLPVGIQAQLFATRDSASTCLHNTSCPVEPIKLLPNKNWFPASFKVVG